MKSTSRIFICAIALLLTLILAGCGYNTALTPSGDLHLALDDISVRSLEPSADMNIDSYRILGQGPQGETIDEATDLSAITLPDLVVGEWLITVDARNNIGETIGRGTQIVQIHTAVTTSAIITLSPLDGSGTLQLSVSWPDADVEIPSISATLTPSSGDPIILPFTIGGGGTASYQGAVLSGYYTLSILLEDSGVVVAGATETIRIIDGFETTGSIDFVDVNAPGGSIEIGVIWEMNDPIAVEISGTIAEITTADSMVLNAGAPAESDPLSFAWYLNGGAVGSGQSFTVNGSIGAGFYRVDVVAFTADGLRSGSASETFRVVTP